MAGWSEIRTLAELLAQKKGLPLSQATLCFRFLPQSSFASGGSTRSYFLRLRFFSWEMFFSLGHWIRSNYNYTLLPFSLSGPEQRNELGSSDVFSGTIVTTTSLIKRRPRISVVLLVGTLVGLAVSSYFIYAIDHGPLPPTFEEYREYERILPQNNESLPLPEGKDGMYLLIENYSTRRSSIEFCLLPLF